MQDATNLGLTAIDSENFKLHYIVDKKTNKVLIVTRSNGYVVLKKEQAETMITDLTEILEEWLV